MKRAFILFLPFVVMLAAGCLKSADNSTTTFNAPAGTFTGVFTKLRYNNAKQKYDTTKANLTLTLTLATGYTVTGDTTLHAGSKGSYSVDPNNILFGDATLNSAASAGKTHLSGLYQYGYDGTNFNIQATYSDTLGFFYQLKKQ